MKEKVKEILAEIVGKPDLVQELSKPLHIINDIGLDSLQAINFILRLEEELGLEIDFDTFDFSHLASIDTLCEFLSGQKSASALPA